MLAERFSQDTSVFTSLHVGEEFNCDYPQQIKAMCAWLVERGFSIMADISPKTLSIFDEADVVELAKALGISSLRVDYGFDDRELARIGAHFPVVINASTATTVSMEKIRTIAPMGVSALHNFYPRPETGLDEMRCIQMTQRIQKAGIPVGAFIPGDKNKRLPIMEGLPTIERHRDMSPFSAYVDLLVNYGMDDVFLGDCGMSDCEYFRINNFCSTGILSVPAILDTPYAHLYERIFTCRLDSPRGLVRFAESRQYACEGMPIEPEQAKPRMRGNVTIDNRLYARYSGEIQLLLDDYPKDDRVNVIGEVPPYWQLLLDCIKPGMRFSLVPIE